MVNDSTVKTEVFAKVAETTNAATVPAPDPWWLLRRQAEAQCGTDAVYAAHLRASAAALRSTPVEDAGWHQAFLAAFAAELQSLLRS